MSENELLARVQFVFGGATETATRETLLVVEQGAVRRRVIAQALGQQGSDVHEAEVDRGLDPAQRARWFGESPAGTWQAKESLRRWIRVRAHNLVGDWPHLPVMDLILIRNVLIYFDEATKVGILTRAREHLRAGGYLMLGTSESLPDAVAGFTQVRVGRTILYRRT